MLERCLHVEARSACGGKQVSLAQEGAMTSQPLSAALQVGAMAAVLLTTMPVVEGADKRNRKQQQLGQYEAC